MMFLTLPNKLERTIYLFHFDRYTLRLVTTKPPSLKFSIFIQVRSTVLHYLILHISNQTVRLIYILRIVDLNHRNKLICDLQNIRRYRLARVSALSLSHHLLYHTTNGTVAFFCLTRRCARTYSIHSYSYMCVTTTQLI